MPIINESVKIFKECDDMDSILKRAEGKSLYANIREGIVFKSTKLINNRYISFKVINNKFLLKND